MCINHYEYAKGPSRITRTTPSEQPFDSMAQDIDYAATGIPASQPQDYSFMMDLFEQGVQQKKQAETNAKLEWTTVTTSIFTPGIDRRRQAMEVKGVADNLMGASGAVVGGTLGLLTGRPTLVYTGVVYGDKLGRAVGEQMYSAAHWFWDPHPFAASDRTNRQAKELGFGLAY